MTEEKVEESSPSTAAADSGGTSSRGKDDYHDDGNGNNNTIIIVDNLHQEVAAAIEKEIAQDIQESSRSTLSSSPFTTADNTIRSWLVDNTNNYSQSTKKDENLRYKVEVIMRDCAAFIIACSVAIFGSGIIISPDMATLLVLVAATHTIMFPCLLFAIISVWPGAVIWGFSIWIYTSIVLCAATVSDGLFLTVYAFLMFIMMAAFFDSFRKGVDPGVIALPGLYMAFVGSFSLTYKHLVQNGPSFDFVPGDNMSEVDPFRRAIVNASLGLIGVLETTSESEISFMCPEEAGVFTGQTCKVAIKNSSSSDLKTLTASVNGGLYLVAALWSGRGINNPLAVVANFMIMYLWAFVAVAVVSCIPPIRKFRDILCGFIIPETLQGLTEAIESACRPDDGDDNGCNEVENPFLVDREKLSLMSKKVSPKKNAKILVFEPRFCHDPTIDHIPYMETFLEHIQSLVLLVYNYHGYYKARGLESPNLTTATNVLRAVSSAVKDNDLSILADKPLRNLDDVSFLEQGSQNVPLSGVIESIVARISLSCHMWLNAYNNRVDVDDRHRTASTHRFVLDWVAKAMCSFQVITSNWLVVGLRLLLGRQGANLEKVGPRRLIMTLLWSAKWVAGAIALLCLQMYGPNYSVFQLVKMSEGNFELQGLIRSWELLAYSLSIQFSAEGTIKKALMRALGTCLGAFSAWIGIMLCSWSYDGKNPPNPYAWILWLAVCLFGANFFGKDPGIAAFFGMEYRMSIIWFYFNLTLAIVGMDAFVGAIEVNAGVANRIASNLVGIAMAWLVSILPPYYSGKDPRFTIEYCEAMQQLQHDMTFQYIANNGMTMEAFMHKGAEIEEFRKKAEITLVDSGRLSILPFFRASPQLKKILDILISEEAYSKWILKELIERKFFKSQNRDVALPAYQAVLEGNGPSSPAILTYLNEAGEREGRLFQSFVTITIRLRILREKLELYEQEGWFLMS